MARLPYGRQWIDRSDLDEVLSVLQADFVTQGPQVEAFEQEFAARVGAKHAVAVSSGTMALFAALRAARLEPGDEVITSPLTFVATANAIVANGGVPVFVDIDERTGLIDPTDIERRITSRTRTVVTVDYAGNPCDYDEIGRICRDRHLLLVADAAHSLGATYRGKPSGSLADLTTFSFHPVKHITTGEGGMVTTDRDDLAAVVRRYRNHGIERDPSRMSRSDGPWFYEVVEIGENGRITDFQCALGRAQLRRLDGFVGRRREIAGRYRHALKDHRGVRLCEETEGGECSYHLFVVRTPERAQVYDALRSRGILAQVHYIPVPDHPYYRARFPADVPRAREFYRTCLSIPMFPRLSDGDVDAVIGALREALP